LLARSAVCQKKFLDRFNVAHLARAAHCDFRIAITGDVSENNLTVSGTVIALLTLEMNRRLAFPAPSLWAVKYAVIFLHCALGAAPPT
jgi:hypothetical protein